MNEQRYKEKRHKLWLILFLIIVIIDFLIPYTILKDIASFYASYMFWTILTIVTIILGYVYLSSWRE
ncbi:MAG: hypothetical protein QW372_00915 [Nitrososphaerales archaeon]